MATVPGQLPGMSSPEDLAAAGDYDPAAAEGGDGSIQVCIKVTPDGQISVYSLSHQEVEPRPAEGLEQALRLAGQMLQELSDASSQAAAGAPQEQQMDPQAMWDQMAAQRPQRGNT